MAQPERCSGRSIRRADAMCMSTRAVPGLLHYVHSILDESVDEPGLGRRHSEEGGADTRRPTYLPSTYLGR